MGPIRYPPLVVSLRTPKMKGTSLLPSLILKSTLFLQPTLHSCYAESAPKLNPALYLLFHQPTGFRALPLGLFRNDPLNPPPLRFPLLFLYKNSLPGLPLVVAMQTKESGLLTRFGPTPSAFSLSSQAFFLGASMRLPRFSDEATLIL